MCHRDGVDVVVGCCSDNSNITLGDICSLCFVSCGLVLCFYTSNAIVEVTGITYYSNLVTNVLYRNLHFHTGSDIVAIVVVLNLTTIVYNCHLNTLYIRSHGGCRVCSALSLWSEVRTVLDEVPSGSHISGSGRLVISTRSSTLILYDCDRVNISTTSGDNLYVPLFYICVCNTIIGFIGRCRCSTNRVFVLSRIGNNGELVFVADYGYLYNSALIELGIFAIAVTASSKLAIFTGCVYHQFYSVNI